MPRGRPAKADRGTGGRVKGPATAHPYFIELVQKHLVDRQVRKYIKNFAKSIKKQGKCWVWTGWINSKGYGKIRFCGKMVFVHRFMWMLCFGPIPPGYVVMHKCDNCPCIRPDHLMLGTNQDNMDDMVRKGRCRGGRKKKAA